MTDIYQFFVTCPKHLEGTLTEEINHLIIPKQLKVHQQGIAFYAQLRDAYRLLLWSRIANRVLLHLLDGPAASSQALYDSVSQIDWLSHFKPSSNIFIHFTGTNNEIRHANFGAQKAKDAIVDQIRQRTGLRPSIQTENSLHLYIRLKGLIASIYLDLAGGSLHQRGYRQEQGPAPLKENLAAAILHKAQWPIIAASGGALVDPMCGSGTLLIEGAWMAANIAPGLLRRHWSCHFWQQHPHRLWHEIMQHAREERTQGLNQIPPIFGFDIHPIAIKKAKRNAAKAGLKDHIDFQEGHFKKSRASCAQGLIAVNPPYGERLENPIALRTLYREFGQHCREHFSGWALALITGDDELGFQIGLNTDKKHHLKNGGLDCSLLHFKLAQQKTKAIVVQEQGTTMLVNRLQKNLKKLKRFRQQTSTNAFRWYDADIPEYAVAIDCYGDHLHIQEYAAPNTISMQQAKKHLGQVLDAVLQVMPNLCSEHIAIKERSKQKGHQQYQKQAERDQWLQVYEGAAHFWVNLFDYLDTGLFLDHRPLRLALKDLATDKKVLNLFGYTGSISVQAVLAGAKQVTQVDLSNTYNQWTQRNLDLNNIASQYYHLITADCMPWLERCQHRYDLIIIDPPAFSNSKKMQATLDIQRDHVHLIDLAMQRLTPEGLLIFSNPLRTFTMDHALSNRYQLENKTPWSIPEDFCRNPKIHQLWFVRHFQQ